jgi:protein ImuB
VLTAVDVVDRIRWQLEGWLNGLNAGRSHARPTGGVSRLVLVPVEVVPTGAHQQSLWGGAGKQDELAHRALARVQTLLGPGSVLTPTLQGGRNPTQRTGLIPWGDEPEVLRSPEQPWPGQLPAPAPSILIDPPRPVQVLDEAGQPVRITERGALPRPPAQFAIGAQRPVSITSWAGPWPVDERWWEAGATGLTARFQIVDVRGGAYLVSCTMVAAGPAQPSTAGTAQPTVPNWTMEAIYD